MGAGEHLAEQSTNRANTPASFEPRATRAGDRGKTRSSNQAPEELPVI